MSKAMLEVSLPRSTRRAVMEALQGKPDELWKSEPTLDQIRAAAHELAELGLVYDTGKRHAGRIVWAATSKA